VPNGRVDVLVVGAGYTGLSAALTLARAGRHVLVCDAGEPGLGASTRNGGMIGSGHRLNVGTLRRKYGERLTADLLKEGLTALDFTVGLIADEGIDCGFERTGRFRAACRADGYESMAAETERLRRLTGLEADMVPRGEQHDEVDTDAYFGGCVYHRHGALHPARFHRGLRARAETSGVRIAGRMAVRRIVRADGGGFRIETDRGAIVSRDVIVATNGYTGRFSSYLRRRILPLSSYMIATEELPPAVAASIIPGGRMIVEDRSLHGYYRLSPDRRRLLFGGRAALHAIDPWRAGAMLRRYAGALFPALADIGVERAWTGHIAYTAADMPHLGAYDGVHYALGYCGSGVAMAPYLGYRIAHKVMATDDGRTAFDALPFRAPPYNLLGNRWHLPVADLYYRARAALFG